MTTKAIALVLAAVGAGCPAGGSNKGGDSVVVAEIFECNERQVEYVITGGFAATEAGVSVQCDGKKPRLTKWSLSDDGERQESTHLLSSDTFEEIWDVIDDTGWRHIEEECANPDATDQDPVYTIEVVDYAVTKTLTCQGKEIPFPYHQLVRELDVRAAAVGE